MIYEGCKKGDQYYDSYKYHYFEDDEFVKEVLGEHVHKKYLEAKRGEWNRFR